jgi:hypothetical protein
MSNWIVVVEDDGVIVTLLEFEYVAKAFGKERRSKEPTKA